MFKCCEYGTYGMERIESYMQVIFCVRQNINSLVFFLVFLFFFFLHLLLSYIFLIISFCLLASVSPPYLFVYSRYLVNAYVMLCI